MEWQPIETAPKDGNPVLVAGEGRVEVARWIIDKGEILVAAHPTPYWEPFDNSGWEFSYALQDGWFDPSHWMPMPSAP